MKTVRMRGLNYKIQSFCLLLLAAVAMAGCRPKQIDSAQHYYAWLADPENGLVKEKSVAGVHYRIKYLPTEYLAYTALAGKSQASATERDSVLKQYAHSMTFLLNIGPDKGEEFDVTRVEVKDYEDFMERVDQLAFHMQDWISLENNGREQRPALARMENLNAPERSRNFIVVFDVAPGAAAAGDPSKELCFTYHDGIFNTGTNKFLFDKDDLNDIPQFNF